jgi:hypothetical protein
MVTGAPARVVAAIVCLLAAGTFTPIQAAEKWGPFRGQLVDQATGKGIAGAAVIAIWWKNEPNPIQMNRSFFDAIEAVTDADGRFEIPRYPSPPFFDFLILPVEITYFAPSYVPLRKEVTPSDAQPFVAPTVVVMERIDPKDSPLRRADARPGGVPLEKMKEFTKAVNVERRMRGFSLLPIPGEENKP